MSTARVVQVPNGSIQVTRSWFIESTDPVASPTTGNAVRWLIDGEEAFSDICDQLSKAKRIWIAGWGITPFVRLRRGPVTTTLMDVLRARSAALGSTFEARVLLWDAPTMMGMKDEEVEDVLETIPGVRVLRHRSSLGNSHHQKAIIADDVAYLGGLDLLVGRWDTNAHPITPMSNAHQANWTTPPKAQGFFDDYNANNPAVQLDEAKPVDPQLLAQTPRTPWHDVHARLEGPVVQALARNFVERWTHHNAAHAELRGKASVAVAAAAIKSSELVEKMLQESLVGKKGAIHQGFGVDVESPLTLPEAPAPAKVSEHANRASIQLVRTMPENAGGSAVIKDIQDAYENAILGATRYIYIENQYFISKTVPQDPRSNKIINTLLKKVRELRDWDKHPFHIYIMVPHRPEGLIGPTSSLREKLSDPELRAHASEFRTHMDQLYRLYEWLENAKDTLLLKSLREELSSTLYRFAGYVEAFLEERATAIASDIVDVGRGLADRATQLAKSASGLLPATATLGGEGGLYDSVVKRLREAASQVGKWVQPSLDAAQDMADRTIVAPLRKLLKDTLAWLDTIFSPVRGAILAQQASLLYLREQVAKIVAPRPVDSILSIWSLYSAGPLAGRLSGEQVYVHSKVMIVDDRVVIIGSANLFDRSLEGKRDTEVAAVVIDQEQSGGAAASQGETARTLAKGLRKRLWSEHFGLSDADVDNWNEHAKLKAIASKNYETLKTVFMGSDGAEFPGDNKADLFERDSVWAPYSDEASAKLSEMRGHAILHPLHYGSGESPTILEDAASDLFSDLRTRLAAPAPIG